jgi:hypothetical protein
MNDVHEDAMRILNEMLTRYRSFLPPALVQLFESDAMTSLNAGSVSSLIYTFLKPQRFETNTIKTHKKIFIDGMSVIRFYDTMGFLFNDKVDSAPSTIPGYGVQGRVSLGRFGLVWALVELLESYNFMELGTSKNRLINGEAIVLPTAKDGGPRVILRQGYPYTITHLEDYIGSPTEFHVRMRMFQLFHTALIKMAFELDVLDKRLDRHEWLFHEAFLNGASHNITSHLTHEKCDVNPKPREHRTQQEQSQ